ncbi:bifunctional 2-C-methyl-D-erythritol 4-phosphate cytidylyltransferase/2-C-methyl-D-erythritol 2,4-cyclodiphosphate synthase [Arsenicitalea aurantiaca]|uniref:Bifunctional enzyme IspD/IspF n=1 Tax=Arsenicitalea aurantiaca TaxID=1783274 RepID=A0A433XGI6_9HYPH|nr:bifunctional 2-C-methyl-D-erythritol 4-phosphate cytidylyltransferase/2-C-methyl-D-erythritol 2,4-cyclodiphosphate synthase [Arsenicitalea aurantiaca]
MVVAAGRGERARSGSADPKQYHLLAGRPVLEHTLRALLSADRITHVLAVIHPEHDARYEGIGISDARLLPPVHGGATRQASVLAGLKAIAPMKPDLVLIHDAARPMVTPEIVDGVIAGLADSAGTLPVVPVTDTIKRSDDGRRVALTEERSRLFAAQTPQGFRFAQIFSAHMRAERLPREFTDDAAIAEWAGLEVAFAPGSSRNIKITLPEDFERAERLMTGNIPTMETRIGTGFDVHPFTEGDAVFLGGVRIEHDRTLEGHSDADVALHALSDALFGAIGEGDIGQHFPPSDPQWKGAASRIFVEHAASLVAARGGRIVNLDLTLVCEAPKIGPHVPAMREAIAAMCGITPDRVAVKATTNERLGFIGRREGMVALASASVELPRSA